MPESWTSQDGFDVRFEWGMAGVLALAPHVRVMVIVDVLRFTTAVEAAVSRRAIVYPFSGGSCAEFARSRGAVAADGSNENGYSLSPASLLSLTAGDAVVLPSPNGSACAAAAAGAGVDTVVAVCLRNARATADWIGRRSAPYAVIACGERWPDGSLRPALEDALAAGAVIQHLPGPRSPEAGAAAAAWVERQGEPLALLSGTASARELAARGANADVAFAADLDVSTVVPILVDGAFRAAPPDDGG